MSPTPSTRALRLGLAPRTRLAATWARFDAARFRLRTGTHLRRWALAYAAAFLVFRGATALGLG